MTAPGLLPFLHAMTVVVGFYCIMVAATQLAIASYIATVLHCTGAKL